MSERYNYHVKRQEAGRGELRHVATRDFAGDYEGQPLPEPVIQRLEACARGKDERHEFLFSADPAVQAQAANRDRWVFERVVVAKAAKAPKTQDPPPGGEAKP